MLGKQIIGEKLMQKNPMKATSIPVGVVLGLTTPGFLCGVNFDANLNLNCNVNFDAPMHLFGGG